MRRVIFVFIIIFLALFFLAGILTAQEIKWRNHRFEASYSYEYLDPHGVYGDWHNVNFALYTDVSPTFTYFVEGTLFSRREGDGIMGTIGVYKDWASFLQTYSAISAGSNTGYLHRFRADHDFIFKSIDIENFKFTIGATYIHYSDNRYDFIISGGPALYLDTWILQYRLFRNDSYPGSVESFSHLISVGYGREYWQWTYLDVSFGKQAYLENTLAEPERIRNNSLNIDIKHRHWLGKHYGIFGKVSFFNLKNEYDKYGVTCGVFYEF